MTYSKRPKSGSIPGNIGQLRGLVRYSTPAYTRPACTCSSHLASELKPGIVGQNPRQVQNTIRQRLPLDTKLA